MLAKLNKLAKFTLDSPNVYIHKCHFKFLKLAKHALAKISLSKLALGKLALVNFTRELSMLMLHSK